MIGDLLSHRKVNTSARYAHLAGHSVKTAATQPVSGRFASAYVSSMVQRPRYDTADTLVHSALPAQRPKTMFSHTGSCLERSRFRMASLQMSCPSVSSFSAVFLTRPEWTAPDATA